MQPSQPASPTFSVDWALCARWALVAWCLFLAQRCYWFCSVEDDLENMKTAIEVHTP